MRDPGSYLQALSDAKVRAELAASVASPPPVQAAPAPVVTPGQRQAVRQRTFVESSSQVSGPPQAAASSQDPNVVFAQAWAATMQLPWGAERAAAQKKLLHARGAGQVSGYRDPQVLTS